MKKDVDIKEIEMSLDEYLVEYYKILKEEMPELIKYLDLINDEVCYIIQLYYLNMDSFQIESYEKNFDEFERINLVRSFLKDINPEYDKMYVDLIKQRKLLYGNYKMSHTKSNKVYIRGTNDIEEVIVTIHELFHYIHLSMYDYDTSNTDWYILTEMIAIMFEFYVLFSMYQNDLYRNDIRSYFYKVIGGIYIRADNIASESLILDIYDKMGSIDDDAIEKFKDEKNIPDGYMDILFSLEGDTNPFTYHENATYMFAFPMSLIGSMRMLLDKEYFDKIINVFNNINNYSFNEILDEMELSYILSDEDNRENLYRVMEYIDTFIKDVSKDKDFKYLKLGRV